MASEVIESEAALKGLSDMSLNNSTVDFVTPSRTHEDLGNIQASSPSSSGVSGEGDDEDINESQISTTSTVENGEEAFEESSTKTRGSSQRWTTADNVEKQTEGRSSTPVSLPQPLSPPGPIGRSVFFFFFMVPCSYFLLKITTLFFLYLSQTSQCPYAFHCTGLFEGCLASQRFFSRLAKKRCQGPV